MTKILLDQSMPFESAALLRELGYDAVHATEIGMRFAPDHEYLIRASAEGSIVVTLDADFHSILANHGMTAPSTIHLRLHNPDERLAADVTHMLCARYKAELSAGYILTYKAGSERIRPLPINRPPSNWKPRLP